MPGLQAQLDKCPHCSVDKPSLSQNARFSTTNFAGSNQRFWVAYACSRCGGVVIAASPQEHGNVHEIYPSSRLVNDAIPNPARSYLQQAIDTLHAPAGSVMLSASSVDARTILSLGRDSIKDHTTAVLELVKNSYDADAGLGKRVSDSRG